MNKLLRRALMTGAGAVAILGLAAGPASAHFCFKTNLNARAAQGMSGSANWVSFSTLAAEFLPGLCDAGIEHLATAAGATPSTLINSHGTMAAGTLKKGPDSGTPSISHLDFEALDAAVPAAFALCAD
jgi:MFS family permease